MARGRRAKLAVWKFASCDGCQLSVLDLEDELLDIAGALDIAYFKEATSVEKPGPFDLSLWKVPSRRVTTPSGFAKYEGSRRRSSRSAPALPGSCRRRRLAHDSPGRRQSHRGAPRHLRTAALLRGVSSRPLFMETPDITSRICGICPVAYLMSACHAMEDALGVHVGGPLRTLRRLLYCSEWIESHALHVFLLHTPDFLGFPDAMSMARKHAEWVKRGLRIKKAGNILLSLLGGREIHPIDVRVGGFYRAPTRGELEVLLPELRWGRDAAAESLEWMAGFDFPKLERDYEFVALRHPDEYPLCEGRLVSSRGLDIDIHDYDAHFVEEQAPYSSALRSRIKGRGAYLCGPLARFNLNFEQLFPEVQELARRIGLVGSGAHQQAPGHCRDAKHRAAK